MRETPFRLNLYPIYNLFVLFRGFCNYFERGKNGFQDLYLILGGLIGAK